MSPEAVGALQFRTLKPFRKLECPRQFAARMQLLASIYDESDEIKQLYGIDNEEHCSWI
jgi:hypothetical protein